MVEGIRRWIGMFHSKKILIWLGGTADASPRHWQISEGLIVPRFYYTVSPRISIFRGHGAVQWFYADLFPLQLKTSNFYRVASLHSAVDEFFV